jgi:hypothetical protein
MYPDAAQYIPVQLLEEIVELISTLHNLVTFGGIWETLILRSIFSQFVSICTMLSLHQTIFLLSQIAYAAQL